MAGSPKLRSGAKTIALRWFDQTDGSLSQRRAFAAALDAFFNELPRRDSCRETLGVVVGAPHTPRFSASTPRMRATSCSEGLIVGTIVPGWGFDWRTIISDDASEHVLSWFGHYARQYVHRSEVARILMVAWERHSVVLHPFGHSGPFMHRRYTDFSPSLSPRAALGLIIEEMLNATGPALAQPTNARSKWLTRNTLDPAIHEAIFHFLRAQNLLANEFEIEAIVAFDCMVQALMRLWNCRKGENQMSRRDFCLAIGMSERSADLAEHTYFLRNHFGAHAGGWRWWDAGEEIDESVEDISRLAHRILRRVADLEPSIRRVEPYPESWSDWLFENFPLIWAATWFK